MKQSEQTLLTDMMNKTDKESTVDFENILLCVNKTGNITERQNLHQCLSTVQL